MESNNNSKAKVFIHCQYVYGIGHFVRTTELANGLSQNFHVYIFNGGENIPNFEFSSAVNFIQLPAVYKEEARNELIPVDKSEKLSDCFDRRRNILHHWIKKIVPDLIITEHFPFGLLFEKEAVDMIETAQEVNPNVKIVCSVRDIIESSKGNSNDGYACDLLNKFYDFVLVHGDESFAPLSKSFPEINKIKIPVFHTGYIVRALTNKSNSESIPVILASVAAGRLGSELLDAMIDTHARLKAELSHRLILFSGVFQKDLKKLQNKVSSLQSNDLLIYPFDRRKYLGCLSTASLVISLGGYNSIIESVSVNKPLLVYNREFAGGNEEQNLRIKMFQKAGYLEVINPKDLEVDRLANLILITLNKWDVPDFELNMNGVQNTRRQLLSLLKS